MRTISTAFAVLEERNRQMNPDNEDPAANGAQMSG